MYLKAVTQAVPSYQFTQKAVWERIKPSPQVDALSDRSRGLLEKILTGDSGIEQRSFALPDPLSLLTMGAEELNNHYEHEAPQLATQAVHDALAKAGIAATDLDALFVCSCTGYLCPGLSSHVAEQLGMRADSFLQDVNGFGCGAAVPMWRAAEGFLAANPQATVATVAVEICSLAFFMNDEPGVLVSMALFGDGAAASIWAGAEVAQEGDWQMSHFRTHHVPTEREKIRFVNSDGFLKNQLHRTVPRLAGEAVQTLWNQRSGEPDGVLSHSGGREVVDEVEKVVGRALSETRSIMRQYGNCSSPSVMMALAQKLAAQPNRDQHLWLTAFGAGFSAHCCELKRSC